MAAWPRRRRLQKEGRVRFLGFSTHATTDVILETVDSGEFDYVNLHWYFVNPLNWPAIVAARKHDMGVFIISPNDKGGKLYEPPPKMVELCAPLSPMEFNDLYCLARPEVHTLSCGAARPEDFDAHVRALDYYDKIPETIAPIERRLRAEMERVLGGDWCNHWSRGPAPLCRRSGRCECHGNPAPLDLRQVARPGRLGKNALQFDGAGGPLVPGRERGQNRREKVAAGAGQKPLRATNPRHPGRIPRHVFRQTGGAFEQELNEGKLPAH